MLLLVLLVLCEYNVIPLTALPEECFCIQHFQLCSSNIICMVKLAYDEAYSTLGNWSDAEIHVQMYTATDFAFNQMGKIVRLPCGILNIFAHYYALCHIWTHTYGRIDACVVTKTSAVMHVTWFYTNLRNAQNWDSKSERTNTHM